MKSEPSTTSAETNQDAFTLEDLSYDLPEELIAQEPLAVRHESRLLVLDRANSEIHHCRFADIANYLNPGDLLVVNDTKVLPARLLAKRQSGGEVRIQLIKPCTRSNHLWEAMGMPLRRIKPGEHLRIETPEESGDGQLKEQTREILIEDIIEDADGYKRLIINFLSNENMRSILTTAGHAPLPPYIRRELGPKDHDLDEKRKEDLSRYQTIFAKAPGAVAAPTAGLHFSDAVFDSLKGKGVKVEHITLHVGAGTFKPITSTIEEHSVEAESYSIGKNTASRINEVKANGKRVIAVGTTSMRALESSVENGTIQPYQNRETNLFIKPGHQFKIVDSMVTNFHLSGSSLLVLVATFAGKERILKAYQEAIAQKYRFYSYGDAMLII